MISPFSLRFFYLCGAVHEEGTALYDAKPFHFIQFSPVSSLEVKEPGTMSHTSLLGHSLQPFHLVVLIILEFQQKDIICHSPSV